MTTGSRERGSATEATASNIEGTFRVVNATMPTVTRSRSRFNWPTCNYNENAPRARTFSSGKSACPVPEDDFILWTGTA